MDTKSEPNTAYQAMLSDAQRRRKKALDLQQQGKSLKEIGLHFGVSRERARQMVAAAIKEGAGQ